ncbi:MAG: hypothetical protein MZW92_54935 [Comamonadaceae bacterium]|nr:hypothetical protein [Comamonadaceae bacterium]
MTLAPPAPTWRSTLAGARVGGVWGFTSKPGHADALARRAGAGLSGGGLRCDGTLVLATAATST